MADWFALMNDKMGGDLAKIKDVGRYFVEVPNISMLLDVDCSRRCALIAEENDTSIAF